MGFITRRNSPKIRMRQMKYKHAVTYSSAVGYVKSIHCKPERTPEGARLVWSTEQGKLVVEVPSN